MADRDIITLTLAHDDGEHEQPANQCPVCQRDKLLAEMAIINTVLVNCGFKREHGHHGSRGVAWLGERYDGALEELADLDRELKTDRELLDRIAYLERDRDFWKDQQHFAANVAATIADLDEEAPVLRQLLGKEIDRRKQAEAAVTTADYARQQAVEQFTAALLTGLDDLPRDQHRRIAPGDVEQLVARVALEVGR